MTDMADEPEPEYPCGLCIYLEKPELDKLGLDITSLPVGVSISFDVIAKVTGVSQKPGIDGEVRECLDLQITDIGIETDEDDDAKPVVPALRASSAFDQMYSKKG